MFVGGVLVGSFYTLGWTWKQERQKLPTDKETDQELVAIAGPYTIIERSWPAGVHSPSKEGAVALGKGGANVFHVAFVFDRSDPGLSNTSAGMYAAGKVRALLDLRLGSPEARTNRLVLGVAEAPGARLVYLDMEGNGWFAMRYMLAGGETEFTEVLYHERWLRVKRDPNDRYVCTVLEGPFAGREMEWKSDSWELR
jgi:hypothetical protein